MKRIFLVFPGHVKSINDGDIHYIGFAKLCNLYGVDITKCINADYYEGIRGVRLRDTIPLTVRSGGDYRDWLMEILPRYKI